MSNDAFDSRLLLEHSEEEGRKQADKLKLETKDRALLYCTVFKSDAGGLVLSDLENTFSRDASFKPGTNLNDVCYEEGRKSVIRHITALINYKYEA